MARDAFVDLTPLLSLEPFYSLGYDYMEILSLFLTSAFIITGPQDCLEDTQQKIQDVNMQLIAIGTVSRKNNVILQIEKEQAELFRLK